ncbi:Endoglucanase 4 [termite gut metagenome]|uniref:Endoglucanase 4 n=1 Tax=termite gut metagenome TaxID=433724 RepID=A0A5J4QFE9_9ZZZZ
MKRHSFIFSVLLLMTFFITGCTGPPKGNQQNESLTSSVVAQNVILVNSSHWDQDIHLPADNPITGYDNIMYTLHFYAATHKQELKN